MKYHPMICRSVIFFLPFFLPLLFKNYNELLVNFLANCRLNISQFPANCF